ncbi:trypsin-like peptidase domain-containing protein [Pseudarthrobacter sp. N5]|uniref:S1C family serine protease n=1 Tax=Pseudarthrobacter sp. N5 TaxID=3418416 RepID=UPI003CEDAC82
MTENPAPGAAPENRDPARPDAEHPAGRDAHQDAATQGDQASGRNALTGQDNAPDQGEAENPTVRLERPENGSQQQEEQAGAPRPVYPPREPFYGQPNGPATQQFASAPQQHQNQDQPNHAPYQQVPYGQHAAPAVGPANAPKRKAAFGVGTLVASILAAGLVGGGVATVAGGNLFGGGSAPAASTGNQPGTVIVNNKDDVNVITAAALKASPSVVTIKATSGSEGGTGSGIVLDNDGHILTNTHVVTLDGKSASASIQVRTSDGKVLAAKIVGTDPLSDLAVIKVDNASGLTAASLGDSSKLNVGDTAVAIGAPLGLTGTVTDGIVSTLNRTISVASSAVPKNGADSSQSNGDGGFQFAPPGGGQNQSTANQGSISINVIQTDAAINPGNSGGALVNSKGEVIGVNVAIASAGGDSSSSGSSGNIGVGFSIPINNAKRVAQEIINTGKATHGQLGVSVKEKAASAAASGFSVGADVATVESGSAAAKAGIKVGDVITKFNDLAISDPNQLTASVREQSAGATVKISILRNGQPQELDVTLGAAAEQ